MYSPSGGIEAETLSKNPLAYVCQTIFFLPWINRRYSLIFAIFLPSLLYCSSIQSEEMVSKPSEVIALDIFAKNRWTNNNRFFYFPYFLVLSYSSDCNQQINGKLCKNLAMCIHRGRNISFIKKVQSDEISVKFEHMRIVLLAQIRHLSLSAHNI
jgi:hypothetical protein